MSYCRQVTQVDLLSGMAPRVPFVALGEIAERARHQLGDATLALIIELVEIFARIRTQPVFSQALQRVCKADGLGMNRVAGGGR